MSECWICGEDANRFCDCCGKAYCSDFCGCDCDPREDDLEIPPIDACD